MGKRQETEWAVDKSPTIIRKQDHVVQNHPCQFGSYRSAMQTHCVCTVGIHKRSHRNSCKAHSLLLQTQELLTCLCHGENSREVYQD